MPIFTGGQMSGGGWGLMSYTRFLVLSSFFFIQWLFFGRYKLSCHCGPQLFDNDMKNCLINLMSLQHTYNV